MMSLINNLLYRTHYNKAKTAEILAQAMNFELQIIMLNVNNDTTYNKILQENRAEIWLNKVNQCNIEKAINNTPYRLLW